MHGKHIGRWLATMEDLAIRSRAERIMGCTDPSYILRRIPDNKITPNSKQPELTEQ